MLTADLLKQNDKLSSLTPEQVEAIVRLSQNDEERVIDQKTAEIHGKYDADIEAATGMKKPGGEKTYKFLTDVLTGLKAKADSASGIDGLNQQITDLKTEKAKLEEQIKSGKIDDAVKAQIGKLEKDLSDKTSELNALKGSYEKEKTTLQGQLENAIAENTKRTIENEFDKYVVTKELKFDGKIPSVGLQEILTGRRAALLSELKPDHVSNGTGNKVMVFRDDKGEIIRNPTTMAPKTAGEFYHERIADLLDKGQPGSGSGSSGGGGGGNPTLNLSTAKTQVEADDMIVKYLMEVEGLTKFSPNFPDRQMELRKNQGIEKLPVK